LDTRARFVAGLPQRGALLDLGSSDGATLGHMGELRPDLQLFAVDLEGKPDSYPKGCQFFRCNLESDRMPWPDGTMDGITCMHLVEHINDLKLLFQEVSRLLKPGGRIYFETPHPKTLFYPSPPSEAAGTFTMNFFDDLTHIRPVTAGGLAQRSRQVGLQVVQTGISRNWIFAAAYAFYFFQRPSRQKYTAWGHLRGWSAYLIASKAR
jgi:SAM-dependent methyltransferase